jgi:hypothetical protein
METISIPLDSKYVVRSKSSRFVVVADVVDVVVDDEML